MNMWLAVRRFTEGSWLEFRYEDVVADLDGQARRILGFLDLPWDDKVLRFYEHARAKVVRSPTYKDVTQPVYQRLGGPLAALRAVHRTGDGKTPTVHDGVWLFHLIAGIDFFFPLNVISGMITATPSRLSVSNWISIRPTAAVPACGSIEPIYGIARSSRGRTV